MFRFHTLRWFALAAALALAACSGSAPQLIGAYPKGTTGNVAPSEALLLVYNAYLTLDVADVDSAAERATQLAYDHGGYLVSSQAWYQDGRKYATLTLAVPVPRFDDLRSALLNLGTLVSETVSGEPKPIRGDDWNTFAHITVQFQPAAPMISLPKLPDFGWNPGRTFGQAFGVFFSIFTFLVDALIWITVIVGPFVLMGFGLRAVVRRMRKPNA
jgi:hypothetical protein